MEKYVTHQDLENLRRELLANSQPPKPKKKRSLSKYNIFMQKEMKKVKSKNPNIDHKNLFRICVENWNDSKK